VAGQVRAPWLYSTPPAFTEHTITATALGAQSVLAIDLNDDGRLDVLSASVQDDSVSVFANAGGDPPVFSEQVITSSETTADRQPRRREYPRCVRKLGRSAQTTSRWQSDWRSACDLKARFTGENLREFVEFFVAGGRFAPGHD